MYDICVLSLDIDVEKLDAFGFDEKMLYGLIPCNCVFPLELVSEFDAWLKNKLQPVYVSRPDSEIVEYTDPKGNWIGVTDLHVVYGFAITPDKIEMVEHYATVFLDHRL